MKCVLSIMLLAGLVGCASHPVEKKAPLARTYSEPAYSYPASALVFDLPTTKNLPPMDLSRDGRYPMAFAGFQQSTTTYTYTQTNDRQSSDYLDSYDRWTYSESVGTSSR